LQRNRAAGRFESSLSGLTATLFGSFLCAAQRNKRKRFEKILGGTPGISRPKGFKNPKQKVHILSAPYFLSYPSDLKITI
jgi:hypothetical protein